MFKRGNAVRMGAEKRGAAGESWVIPASEKGWVREVRKDGDVEVQFENGVIHICKPSEIGKA